MIKHLFPWFAKEETNVEPFYRSREVWSYTHIDPRTRRASVRPVLIYRKSSDGMFWGLPLVKVEVRGKVMYVPRRVKGKKLSALSQMRTLKASRLVQKLGTAGEREFTVFHNSILRLLAETVPVQQRKVRTYAQLRRTVRATPSPISAMYMLQQRAA